MRLPAASAARRPSSRSPGCAKLGNMIPIIGPASQLRENLGALEIALTPEQLTELDALAPPPAAYPESLLAGDFFRTMMYGEVRQKVRWPGGD